MKRDIFDWHNKQQTALNIAIVITHLDWMLMNVMGYFIPIEGKRCVIVAQQTNLGNYSFETSLPFFSEYHAWKVSRMSEEGMLFHDHSALNKLFSCSPLSH